MLIKDLLDSIDESIDLALAAPWDSVGLQIGSRNAVVGRVGVCHELTPRAVDEVVVKGIDTVVVYHPLLFAPTTSFVDGPTATGRALRLAIAGVSVIAVHTAFDATDGGMADALAVALGVRDAVGIGCHDDGPRRCIGRMGSIDPTTLGAFASVATDVLGTTVRVAGEAGTKIETIAAVPGSGGSFVEASIGADVLVTGDVKHHEAAMALEKGMAVIDAGHIPTERPGFTSLYDAIIAITDDAQRIGPDPYPWKD